ncbi:hypothetical protein [Microbacterium flavum]|uniref:Uncharacterized protein n=1 Tax=Microbacterium flavum TaxID=415216 RepID=A0ABS5XQI7_9MICO|nr:hypothetical protein [Microbacterium flavum]MBT8796711.1 hypothetical protein [Microbacterium flavum]
MTSPLPRRLLPVTVASGALIALALTGCVAESAQPSPSGSSSSARPTASATAGTTPSGSAPAEPGASPTATPTGDPAACLPGTWTMGQGDLESFYADVNAALSGAGVSFTPQGTATLALGADGAFVWTPALQLDAAVSGTTINVSVAGDITGTYTATADHITTTDQSADGLQISATIDGAETDAGDVVNQVAGAPITDAAYTCAGDTLTLVSDVGGASATAVLHRG